MTVGLAYTAAPVSAWPGLGQGETAIEKVAVSWAVLRYSATIPASVEDRTCLAAATDRVLELAARLGKTEQDLRNVLRGMEMGILNPLGRDPCTADRVD